MPSSRCPALITFFLRHLAACYTSSREVLSSLQQGPAKQEDVPIVMRERYPRRETYSILKECFNVPEPYLPNN
jgi:hypothetical protein